jgi:hypothetical protein
MRLVNDRQLIFTKPADHPVSLDSSLSSREWVRRNVEQGSAERGAGARLRDATVEPIKARRFECRSMRVTGGQIPEGRLSRWSRGPNFKLGMRPEIRRKGTARRPRPPARSDPRKKFGAPLPLSGGPSSAPRRAPVSGDATVKAHVSTRAIAALHPAPGDRRNVEQGPACGMRPWSRSRARRSNADLMRVSGVRSPEGPLFRPTTRHPSMRRLEPAPPSAGAG